MKQVLKVFLTILSIAFILIQFIRPAKNTDEEIAENQITANYKKFKEVTKEVKDADMPMFSYTIIHRDAVLGASQKLLLKTGN